MWGRVQQEMATERAMVLAMMSVLARLGEIVPTEGACFDARAFPLTS